MACPDAESIAELVSENCDPGARAAFADHAAACASCHAIVDVLFDHTQAAGDLSASEMPAKIDRYVLRRTLGAGGMGVVYVAYDPELDREIAIKMLRRGNAAARLRREARSLARLSHPNVVAVHDVGEHDGQVFVAMALVDGVDLRRWLRTSRSTGEIVSALLAAGRGIVAAHAAGLIHRDLKPDNIFIARSGDVLVGDFGLARDAGEGTDVVEGTPAYMPPEQVEGRTDERSDQYSFCVTAFEALYGVRPYAGGSPSELHDNARAQRFVDVSRPLDARIDRALRRGLRADPDERFGSMAELLRELAPRSRRAAWFAAASAVAVGAAITATWFATRTDPVASAELQCATAGAPAWNALTRGAVAAALRVQGNTPDAVSEIVQRLDRYAVSWTSVRRDACLAQVSGRLGAREASARIACLGQRRTAFEITAQSLITAPADILVTWRRATTIPSPVSCTDAETARLATVGGQGRETEHRDLMRDLAIATNTGGKAIAEVAARAATTPDVGARLEIALAQAGDALEHNRTVEADVALAIARPLVEQLDVAAMRVRAFALSARSYCLQARHTEANQFLAIAVAGAARLRESDAEAELDEVFLARAECMYRNDQIAELAPLLVERIAYIQRRYGRDSLEEAALHQRLAQVYVDLDRRDDSAREYAAGRRITGRFVKADEAAAVAADGKAVEALQAGDLDGAIAHSRRSIELYAALHHAELGPSLVSIAMLLDLAQDQRGAIDAYSQALDLLPADSSDETVQGKRIEAFAGRGYDRLLVGDLDLAVGDLQTAIDGGERLQRIDLVLEAQLALGRAWVAKAEYGRAVRVFRTSLDVYAKTPNASRWRLAIARFAFAQALWETGDRATARTLGKAAESEIAENLEGMRKSPLATRLVPVIEKLLVSVERWRDGHR